MEKKKSLPLAEFYFGSASETERLRVERALLTDSEALLDYLDFKRQAEVAPLFPQSPSRALEARLLQKMPLRRKIAFLTGGLGVAASVLLFLFYFAAEEKTKDLPQDSVAHGVLFDSGSEPLTASDVL